MFGQAALEAQLRPRQLGEGRAQRDVQRPSHPLQRSVFRGSHDRLVEVDVGLVAELIAALAAVVIGGASLTGGTGSISATVVGVLIPVVLANGLLIGGVERFWQDVVVGIILVAAVWFDQWRSARETRDL